MDKDVEQVLIGSLLGDGCVFIDKRQKNANFSEAHAIKQSDYLRWKARILSLHFGGKVSYDSYNEKIKYFSQTHPFLTEVRYKWYPNNGKIVPEDELQKLDALGLAVWYQDDGSYCYRDHICQIAINKFKDQEFLLQKWFRDRWGISQNIVYQSGPILRFPVKDSDRFLRLIAPFVHPSMIYKLGHLRPENHLKLEEEHKKMLDKSKKYHQKNRDKRLRQHREYYQKNSDKLREKAREYWQRRGKFLRAQRRITRDQTLAP